MRGIVRIATTMAATAALVLPVTVATVGLAAPAQASNHKSAFTVWDGAAREYAWECAATAPFTCDTVTPVMSVQITISNRPRPIAPITVDWAIDEITAVHGVNFTGPTSGTVTIPTNSTATRVRLPVLDTGVDGPDTTFWVRLTGSSLPRADTGDTGTGTVLNGGRIPRDCEPFRHDRDEISLTCDGRPASQQWRFDGICGFTDPVLVAVRGNVVTGNGASTIDCDGTGLPLLNWNLRVLS